MIDFISVAQAAEELAVSAEDPGVIGLLGLDIKLFIAQLVNFSIVLFVLWKWVFNPVTRAMEERTKKIEKSLADTKKIEKKVAELEEYKKKQINRAYHDYEKIVSEAEIFAKKQKVEILLETKHQSEKMIKISESRIAQDKKTMVAEVKEELADLVVAATEKIISEKLEGNQDKKLIEESLEELT